MSGDAPYTGQFMGGIHPRVKKLVGERLAKAARALVYKDADMVWTGPVLSSCALNGNTLVLSFDQSMLKDDTIMVRRGYVILYDLLGVLTFIPSLTHMWSSLLHKPISPPQRYSTRLVTPSPSPPTVRKNERWYE